jgi:hypothetical protein
MIESVSSSDSFEVSGVLATSSLFSIGGTTDVEAIPAVLTFAPIHPNPASGAASFRFGLPVRSHVKLELYDVLGRRVRTLLDTDRPAGWYDAAWPGTLDHGEAASAGMYFARLSVGGKRLDRRLVWLR